MKKANSRKPVRVVALMIGVLLGWSVLCFGNFYVVPVIKKMFAPVQKTGQTVMYAARDDGDLEEGVTWPNPRFTDNGDGTVTDNLTSLVWTKDASCEGEQGQKLWKSGSNYPALEYCNTLEDGTCDLHDGSSTGDWRLPSVRELQSLIHYGYNGPAVPDTAGTGKWSPDDPFLNVKSSYYWSSTTYDAGAASAWNVYFHFGHVASAGKESFAHYVWCVRDGS